MNVKKTLGLLVILFLAVGTQSALAQQAAKPADDTLPVVSKKVQWSLYGKVKMDVSYDTAQFVYYNDFIGAVRNRATNVRDKNGNITEVKTWDYGKDSTDFNPRDCRFGFWGKYAQGNWSLAGRIETDFYGDTNGNNLLPRLRVGYVDFSYTPWKTSILAGQDWIPVNQQNPNTIDFGVLTVAGNLWWREPQITLRQTFLKDFQFLVSVMKHRRTDTNRNDVMPWFLGRLAYNLSVSDLKGVMALGGGWRKADYGTSDPALDIERWLVSPELKLSFKSLTLGGEFWFGQGLGEDFMRYDLDVNPKTNEAIRGIGGWADLTWNITCKLSSTVGYGIDKPDFDDMMEGRTIYDLNERQFTKNTMIFANMWYRIVQPLRVGVEYIHVETTRSGQNNEGSYEKQINPGNRFTTSFELVF